MYSSWPAVLVALLAGACGRIGFDARAIDGGIDDAAAAIDAGIIWDEFQGSGSGEGISGTPTATSQNGRIRVAPDGTLYVLYANNDAGNKDIYLKRWNGVSWEGLGLSALPGGISQDASSSSLGGVAFDASSRPHVTWMDDDGSRSIFYRYWDGSAWLEQLGSSTGRGLSVSANPYWPTIEMYPATGEVLVAYEIYNVVPSGGAIHLKTPTTLDWQGIANSATNEGVSGASGSASLVNLAVEGEQIYAAWQEERSAGTDIYVSMYSPQTGWQALGSSLSAGGISRTSTVSERATIRVRDGKLMVSWTEQGLDGPRAYLRSYHDGEWIELADSASGDGLSGIYSPAQHVNFEFDEQAMPVAVWSHDADGDSDIFAARWDGTGWFYPRYEEGSISATPGNSDYPHIAVGQRGKIYVLWEEYLESSRSAIYLRSLR